MAHDELIARLEAATGPSFTLEQEIFRLLNPNATKLSIPNNYTASIDAALTLVPKGEGWAIMAVKSVFHVGIGDTARNAKWYAVAPTPALAICIAALRARGDA